MARVTREDWLKAGFDLLAEQGFSALTLDNLLSRLGVTHGSFYHHFKNRQQYIDSLLKHWQQALTLDIIRSTSALADLDKRVEKLIDLGLEQSQQRALEVTIRAQAFHDPLVAEYVEQVDRLRLEHCRTLALLATGDAARASTLGNLVHALFVGTQQVLPAFTAQEIRSIYEELQHLVAASITHA